MKYSSVTETAKKTGYSIAWVRRLAQQGRIDGAQKLGGSTWIIPEKWADKHTFKIKRE